MLFRKRNMAACCTLSTSPAESDSLRDPVRGTEKCQEVPQRLQDEYCALMVEKRTTPRHRVLKAATIEFGRAAIDCSIRNISKSGAALDVASPVGIPDTFTLNIPSDKRRFACRVIYRKEKRIGVAFV